MSGKTASQQIDAIIALHPDWKGEMLAQIRTIIHQADPEVIEEVKWKMKNRPEGLAVWSNNGIICFVEIWKDNLKVLFPKGAQLPDPHHLFNARLQSKDIRAIEFKEGNSVPSDKLSKLIHSTVTHNSTS